MSNEEKNAVKIAVPSEPPKETTTKKKKEEGPSDEDLQVQADVELLVTRIADASAPIAATAMETLASLLQTQTGSVASIPKPLKFVRKLFPQLEAAVATMSHEENKRRLHDIMSFIAMTLDAKNRQESSLQHKLAGNRADLAKWGHEYLRFLAGEVAAEWSERVSNEAATLELRAIVDDIVQFMLRHQDESSALDLLMEIQDVNSVAKLVDESNLHRVAAYLVALADYLTSPTDREVLSVACDLYKKFGAFPQALRVALLLRDRDRVAELFSQCDNRATKLQMAFVCGRYRMRLNIEDDDELAEIIGNRRISQLFRHSAKELDSLAPKTAEEIFKTQLDSRPSNANSHMHNLASIIVNGLSNCAFGTDELMTKEGTKPIYQTKDHRMTSATASLGLIHLWDEVDGLGAADKYTYAEESYIKAGAYLATGLTMCGVQDAFDAAFGLLSDHVNAANREERIAAILGLGYAYAGSEKADVKDILVPIIADSEQPFEVQCFAAYAAALVFPGSGDSDLVETCLSCLMEKEDKQLLEPCARLLVLAIGALFIGRTDQAESVLDATQALSDVIRQYTEVVVRCFAFAGTGNVMEQQKLFHLIAENEEPEEDDTAKKAAASAAAPAAAAAAPGAGEGADAAGAAATADATTPATDKPKPINHKAAAVLGIAMIALGEAYGTEMAKRALIHIPLADTVSKKDASTSGRLAVPLAYALLGISTAHMPTVEILNRLSHDGDAATAMNAALGMGIVAAGTNNARVATMLRQLAQYYHKEKDSTILFMVRLAQGLTALGKGHLTLSPLQQDNQVISPVGLVGLMGLFTCALDLPGTILDRYHYMLYAITPAINPRAIIAVDTKLEPIPNGVTVRIGQPIDTVTLAGKPKTITGFQTHNTPVLLGDGDRAEIAPGKYRSLGAVVEGVIIVEEKPATENATA
ncbi:proteasome regulatory non-ATPase subunit, putative [Bodo saltans]|uniref:Proteasome regulatory non-ATPase subunit, putative n=1 Tax=Bodo saltans TaxID=75058 RepID=A0A0S4KJP7_BODSA|nr:proteasome regulatory non-ATPase subunit, putative [Bodo saltans]|eukprot:CUI15396.1 proteasome regulatory non-ATPase subunit, putative [Bodo saltans]